MSVILPLSDVEVKANGTGTLRDAYWNGRATNLGEHENFYPLNLIKRTSVLRLPVENNSRFLWFRITTFELKRWSSLLLAN